MNNLLVYIGLGPCEKTEKVLEGKSSHVLLLSGLYRNQAEVLGRIRLALNPAEEAIMLNLQLRLLNLKHFKIKKFLGLLMKMLTHLFAVLLNNFCN